MMADTKDDSNLDDNKSDGGVEEDNGNFGLYEHVEENGRTYHRYKSGKYTLPNDNQEQDRLDYQHILFLMVFDGKLAFSPVDQIPLNNVLDLATGTGKWAIDFADQYPNANVLGTDLSPIQPTYLPPNCSFIVDDAEDEWLFSHPFDYIHARGVVTCFSDAKAVLKSAYEALIPGGYFEIQDPVLPISWGEEPPADSQFLLWNKLSIEAAAKGGQPWTNTPKYESWMHEIGFEQVNVLKFSVPIGTWMNGEKEKATGNRALGNWMQAIEPMTTRNLSRIGWSAEESQVFTAKIRDELASGTTKPLIEILVTYGRKPKLSSEEKEDKNTLSESDLQPHIQPHIQPHVKPEV